METLAQTLYDNVSSAITEDTMILMVIVGSGSLVLIIGMLLGAAKKITISRHREDTRRELAAYIAEGTLDPDQAVALMNAGRDPSELEELTKIIEKHT